MNLAIAIINRNLPELTDELVGKIAKLGDRLYVVENGSDIDKRSKYANMIYEESNGISFAVNEAIKKAMSDGFDLIWINYNDAWFENPEAYVSWSKRMFRLNDNLALTTGHWPNIWDISGLENPQGKSVISFFDPLSFIISLKSIKDISERDKRLKPFWDSSNYTAHYNILGPAYALYDSGYFMACNSEHSMIEKNVFIGDQKNNLSKLARGFDDDIWKNQEGPKNINSWLKNHFPEYSHIKNDKDKRNHIMIKICKMWRNSKSNVKFV